MSALSAVLGLAHSTLPGRVYIRSSTQSHEAGNEPPRRFLNHGEGPYYRVSTSALIFKNLLRQYATLALSCQQGEGPSRGLLRDCETLLQLY